MGVAIDGLDGFRQRAGQHLGKSEWHEVTQDKVDRFARSIGRDPGASTVAPMHLVSLLAIPYHEIQNFENIPLSVNYGFNRIEFPLTVDVGSMLRLDLSIGTVDEIGDGAIAVTFNLAMEAKGAETPACTMELVIRFYPQSDRLR